jgi:mycothiol S-conjugate amidase
MIHDGESLRLMAVHAHPDDEASKGAATTAYYVAQGVKVMVVTCTGGERGDVLNPALQSPEVLADLPQIRVAEMARSAEILGIEHAWLGYRDSGFPQGDPVPDDSFAAVPLAESVAALVRLVRQFRPHVITTYDENGGYPHPDHIRCHEVAAGAYEAAADGGKWPGLGAPWQPSKLYYDLSFHREKVMALHNAALDGGLASPYAHWAGQFESRPEAGERLTTRIPCSDFFATRDAALLAHASQIDPDGHWFAMPISTQAEAWPTEDFYLADSKVAVELPEKDLFAGLR